MKRKMRILSAICACVIAMSASTGCLQREPETALSTSSPASVETVSSVESAASTTETASATDTSTSTADTSASTADASTSTAGASPSASKTSSTTKTTYSSTKTTTKAKASEPKTYDPASLPKLMGSFSSTEVPEISISKDDFINYTYGRINFKSKYTWLYDFCDDMYTGIGTDMKKSASGEMYYGIHAYVENDSLFFKHYRHCKDEISVGGIQVISDSKEIPLAIANPTEYTEINCSALANGLYMIEMELHDVKRDTDATAFMYFYVNGGKTYLCSSAICKKDSVDDAIERRAVIADLIKSNGITPENSLSTEDLCFPWHPTQGRNDIPNWINLAEEITKEEWSDGLKAFAIHEWMVKNLAYDHYRSDVINKRRATYYNDYSGKYDTFDTKVGVCFDFANIYAAMCRSVGVPAVTLDCKEHTWNMVYVNDRWIEVDVTYGTYKDVYGEDMTAISVSGDPRKYNGFGSLNVNEFTPLYINYWLMTFEKADKRRT